MKEKKKRKWKVQEIDLNSREELRFVIYREIFLD